MIRSIAACLLLALPFAASAAAPAVPADDEIVRLPASGEVRSQEDRERLRADRLKPGGGLLASFDSNGDGRISRAELKTGIAAAFEAADANSDGELTALEQKAWADSLPTRDNSLANPVRFDPNLDRRVSLAEFSAVITNLWADYRDDGDRELRVASLKAPKDERRETRLGKPEEYRGALPGESAADTEPEESDL